MQACSECPIPPIPPASALPTHAVDVLTNRRATVWRDLYLIPTLCCCWSMPQVQQPSSCSGSKQMNCIKPTATRPSSSAAAFLAFFSSSWNELHGNRPSTERVCRIIFASILCWAASSAFFCRLAMATGSLALSPGLSAVLCCTICIYLSNNIFLSFRV